MAIPMNLRRLLAFAFLTKAGHAEAAMAMMTIEDDGRAWDAFATARGLPSAHGRPLPDDVSASTAADIGFAAWLVDDDAAAPALNEFTGERLRLVGLVLAAYGGGPHAIREALGPRGALRF